eukprot:TRINITY_DN67668_c0_g1_i1.p1 TRINITY_DN67668_c0_g1~~TRINITY_DN67668_c0_g1_i1.p1  ORF type:complete len:412 (+),score=68.82 TRINITY_DN67668_c0_g1_i1:125-1237(+)
MRLWEEKAGHELSSVDREILSHLTVREVIRIWDMIKEQKDWQAEIARIRQQRLDDQRRESTAPNNALQQLQDKEQTKRQEEQQQRAAKEAEIQGKVNLLDRIAELQYSIAVLDAEIEGMGAPDESVHYPNGDWYVGDIVEGHREGNGRCIYLNGDIYEGEWRRDVCSGSGTMLYHNMSQYEGEFAEGKPHGEGTLLDVNGTYKGTMQDGLRHGYGAQVYTCGRKFEGLWAKGKKVRGLLTTPNGQVVEVEYDDNGRIISQKKLGSVAPTGTESSSKRTNPLTVITTSCSGIRKHTDDCHKLVFLLSALGVSVNEIDLAQPHHRTKFNAEDLGDLPQVLIADAFVGGYETLAEWNERGELLTQLRQHGWSG